MSKRSNRREFLKGSAMATLCTATMPAAKAGLPASQTVSGASSLPENARRAMPTGKIGSLNVSRLFLGCNQVSGYAHSRDLKYVKRLMVGYQTDEKVLDTWQLCEEHGINTLLSDPFEKPVRLMKQYRRERRGKIQWISEVHPKIPARDLRVGDLKQNIKEVLDNQPDALYIQGSICDTFVHRGLVDELGEALETMKRSGLPSGLGAHSIEVPIACLKAGINPHFYMKTHHPDDYWSATPRAERIEFNVDTSAPTNHDNIWDIRPEVTREVMAAVKCPWIAFKVLAAGAVPVERAFRFALEGGADFLCVGMFDFHVADNVATMHKVLGEKLARSRPWCA